MITIHPETKKLTAPSKLLLPICVTPYFLPIRAAKLSAIINTEIAVIAIILGKNNVYSLVMALSHWIFNLTFAN